MPAKTMLTGVVLALGLAAPALAQGPDTSAADLANTVEIIAHLPGPALWRVSSPSAQLWILGLAGPVPKQANWDTRRLGAALDGARELVVPPNASIGVFDLAGLLIDPNRHYHMPAGQTLRASLPEPLRARFDASAQALGQNPDHYDHWRPMVAAVAMIADAQKYDALNAQGPQNTVMDMAKDRKVPVRRLANYRLSDLLRMMSSSSAAAPNACLALAVDLVPHLPSIAQNIADAWARGDVAAERAAEAQMGTQACFEAAPGVAQYRNKVAADWAKDLAGSLAKPGKTVVAVDMESLTRKGGLLDQMKAEGLEVVGPAY